MLMGIVVLLGVTACGRPGPPRFTISGTVMLDGSPLKSGGVAFLPEDPTAAAAGGEVVDGAFTVTVSKGPHRVEVTALSMKPGADSVPVNIIPRRYNAKTTLSFDVQTAKDQPKFELVSDPKAK